MLGPEDEIIRIMVLYLAGDGSSCKIESLAGSLRMLYGLEFRI